ncbi:MAG: methyl-accepting chemotaxis protein, partial [Nitrosopumilaceae archaeon]
LLKTSHVHLPNGEVQTITTSFQTLHPGLYFVDYTATLEGTYVFHVVTFSQGSTAHGSAATHVLKQDISGISDQILKLNSILDETSSELDTLESRIEEFDSTLASASTNIASSVTTMSSSVENMEEASTQLNSLLFPIVGAIGIIVALQVVILARRR